MVLLATPAANTAIESSTMALESNASVLRGLEMARNGAQTLISRLKGTIAIPSIQMNARINAAASPMRIARLIIRKITALTAALIQILNTTSSVVLALREIDAKTELITACRKLTAVFVRGQLMWDTLVAVDEDTMVRAAAIVHSKIMKEVATALGRIFLMELTSASSLTTLLVGRTNRSALTQAHKVTTALHQQHVRNLKSDTQ